MMSERDRQRKQKADATTALSVQKPSWKVERIAEAIRLSKEENIEDLTQLNELINETGKTLSKLKAQQRKNDQVKEKLQPLHQALLDVKRLESLPSSEDYKMAKAKLYHYGLGTQAKIEDFEKRWEYNQTLEEDLRHKLEQTSKKYTKLKKIKYQVDLAKNKEYCYGRDNIRSK